MIENGICGWAAFGASPEKLGAASTRMQDLVAHKSAPRHIVERFGEAFDYGPAADRSFAQHQGVAIIIKGNPRWRDDSLKRTATERGHAAAALQAYEREGQGFVTQIYGPFAVVLWDSRKPLVVLALDRIGIERLCYGRVDDGLAFSTSAELVARFAGEAQLDNQVLYDFLYFHTVPSPETVFTGVQKLLPGECVAFDGKTLHRQFYWRLRYESNGARLDDLEARLHEILRETVAREGEGENVGAFLSGGTDSSTVSGLLTKARGHPAKTFSIGFSAEEFNEMDYVRIAVQHFGTQSHEYYVTPEDVVEAIPLIARAYDEPFGNDSAVPTYFCARLARANGVSVMLAGDGGDEIFGGNTRYAKQKIFEHYASVPETLRRILGRIVFGLPGTVPPLGKMQSYIRQALMPLPDRLETYNFLHRSPLQTVFEDEFLRKIDPERPLSLLREVFSRADSEDAVNRMMHLDLKFTLADNDLRKVCRMCEVAGVAVRFPLLAEELVEFSGEVPARLKVKGTRLRYFFKRALRDLLPKEILTKSKHGFGVPFGLWLTTHAPLAEQVQGALKRLAQRGIVRPAYISELLYQHANVHPTYYGKMIWVLTQLELWLEHHADGSHTPV